MTTTKVRVSIPKLEQQVYFVVEQLQNQVRVCEIAKQSILNACTAQLTGNVNSLTVVRNQLGGVQQELSFTKTSLSDAQTKIISLQTDLNNIPKTNKWEKIGYVLAGAVVGGFIIKVAK